MYTSAQFDLLVQIVYVNHHFIYKIERIGHVTMTSTPRLLSLLIIRARQA